MSPTAKPIETCNDCQSLYPKGYNHSCPNRPRPTQKKNFRNKRMLSRRMETCSRCNETYAYGYTHVCPKRRDKERKIAVKTKPLAESETLQPVHRELAERDQRTMQGQFKMTDARPTGILGRLAHLRMHDSTALDFRKEGPALAQLSTGEIVLLEPWRGLPNIPLLDSRKICPDCQLKCDECVKGKRLCMRCGGAGDILVHAAQPRVLCPGCKGSKQERCGLCSGTGMRSTGYVRDTRNKKETALVSSPGAARCLTCSGKGYCFEWKPQDISSFCAGLLEGMMIIPLASVAFVPMGEGDVPGVIISSPDLNGNQMELLIEGERAWFYGGVPRIK